MVAEKEPTLANRLAPYRAHYMAEDRRRIEEGLREGKLLGVAATNALELGMDIGGLDATVLTGYPGSVASAWQQAGRGGRRGEASLAVLVARDDPLDQYLMRHPEFFHGRPMEHALIAPDNPYVLAPHLLCAAHEFPLTLGDRAYFGDALPRSSRSSSSPATCARREAAGTWTPPSTTRRSTSTSARRRTAATPSSTAAPARCWRRGSRRRPPTRRCTPAPSTSIRASHSW